MIVCTSLRLEFAVLASLLIVLVRQLFALAERLVVLVKVLVILRLEVEQRLDALALWEDEKLVRNAR